MVIKIMASQKSVAEIARIFQEVCARHKFGVLGSIDIRQKLQEKGLVFDRECVVFEVCTHQAASKVLASDPVISAALPCRISVYQESGKTKLASILPTAMLGMFDQPVLKSVAEEVERTILQIMEDLV